MPAETNLPCLSTRDPGLPAIGAYREMNTHHTVNEKVQNSFRLRKRPMRADGRTPMHVAQKHSRQRRKVKKRHLALPCPHEREFLFIRRMSTQPPRGSNIPLRPQLPAAWDSPLSKKSENKRVKNISLGDGNGPLLYTYIFGVEGRNPSQKAKLFCEIGEKLGGRYDIMEKKFMGIQFWGRKNSL